MFLWCFPYLFIVMYNKYAMLVYFNEGFVNIYIQHYALKKAII